jgi:hypothetical protein
MNTTIRPRAFHSAEVPVKLDRRTVFDHAGCQRAIPIAAKSGTPALISRSSWCATSSMMSVIIRSCSAGVGGVRRIQCRASKRKHVRFPQSENRQTKYAADRTPCNTGATAKMNRSRSSHAILAFAFSNLSITSLSTLVDITVMEVNRGGRQVDFLFAGFN